MTQRESQGENALVELISITINEGILLWHKRMVIDEGDFRYRDGGFPNDNGFTLGIIDDKGIARAEVFKKDILSSFSPAIMHMNELIFAFFRLKDFKRIVPMHLMLVTRDDPKHMMISIYGRLACNRHLDGFHLGEVFDLFARLFDQTFFTDDFR